MAGGDAKSGSKKKKRGPGPIAKAYLVLYNLVQTLGWGYVLVLTVLNYVEGKGPEDVYATVEFPLQVFQTAALLEVIHAAIGIVYSPVMTTLMQVTSRVFLVWGITFLFPVAQVSPFYTSMVVAWSVTEVVRYSFYAAALVDAVPYILLWLRYSLFYILYPMGAGSEWVLVFLSLPTIKETRPLSVDMPNSLNVAFDYYSFCIVILFIYAPGFYTMFSLVMGQRKKKLGGSKPKDGKKDK